MQETENKMSEVGIVFPHQLFQKSELIKKGLEIYLVEEHLFFRQYAFHKQKIAFHRASMKSYQQYLEQHGITVHYIEAQEKKADIRELIPELSNQEAQKIHYIDPVDNWLEKRLNEKAEEHKVELVKYDNPSFLNTQEELTFFKPGNKKYFQTKFYIEQRKKRGILVDTNQQPLGGKWSFDAENRKKFPASATPPSIRYPETDGFHEEAVDYVNKTFADYPGQLSATPLYPTDFTSSEKWLDQFLEERFLRFGDYEDAIVKEASILHHSVLTPMLNVGLLTPQQILDKVLMHAEQNNTPISSLEGFVRQIIGWREFIRGIYEVAGTKERTKNYWGFTRKIPASFYDGTTGIYPIDVTIKKVLQSGYCHHIERLMVLGNFMLLCEFDPDEVYRWFMELFIDAYDWVMVPNVYGMSQFADGGLMSTKPYISGSNYLMKMSNYPKGDWQQTWDALFWRFMHLHRDFFLKNPRLGMLVRTFDKMDAAKRTTHLDTAEKYLASLNA